MFEKVNRNHPDKVADRIAGAVVDFAYERNPIARIAVEVLLGHGIALVIIETNTLIKNWEVERIVKRIGGVGTEVKMLIVPQDSHLAANQRNETRCGDNGIFRGMPITKEQKTLAKLAYDYDFNLNSDGKYIAADNTLVVCQSKLRTKDDYNHIDMERVIVNPLGYWSGGIDTDSGATNRKLGSDMGDAVTGGGLHGKDLSKADVSVNIWCHLRAQELGREVTAWCAIGDTSVHTSEGEVPFLEMVEAAENYIKDLGGFEAFAEYGLIR